MAGFNEAGTNGQLMLQSSGIVEGIAAVVHVAVSAKDGSLYFGSAGRLDVLGQLLDDLCSSPAFEPLLLGLAPPLGRLGPAAFGGIGQILTDMVEVAQEVFLIAEDLATLEADPFCAIGYHMDLAIESPAGGFCAVCPSASELFDFAEGGRIEALAATVSLSCGQAHFLPEARTFAFSLSGFHRADHRAVGFGYHMLAASGRQQAKRFLVLGFQLQARPFGLFQSRRPCCAGRDFKSVVLFALLRGSGKGMLGAKIAKHPIQWFRAPPIAHRDAGGEHSLIAAGRSAPYPFLYFDPPEYTPPIQSFFFA